MKLSVTPGGSEPLYRREVDVEITRPKPKEELGELIHRSRNGETSEE